MLLNILKNPERFRTPSLAHRLIGSSAHPSSAHPYKHSFLVIVLLLLSRFTYAQQVDSIFFNLYTDSLKKGVHNYINVDAKLKNGSWLPLTAKELKFSSSAGVFEGNSLILDTGLKEPFVMVTAILIADPKVRREIRIPIKRKTDNEPLKKMEDVLGPTRNRNSRSGFPPR